MRPEKRLIVGIDFGVAFLDLSEPRPKVKVLGRWDLLQRLGVIFVPSRIGYNNGLPTCHEYVVYPEAELSSWTKLLLDGRVDDLEFAPKSMRESLGSGILHIPASLSPFLVVSDFLRYVCYHIGDQIPKVYPEDMRVFYIITVPAARSQATRDAMERAARGAGFGSAKGREHIIILSEPEAATLTMLSQKRAALQDGNGWLGDAYKVSQPRHHAIEAYHIHGDTLVYEVEVYECSLVTPPDRIDPRNQEVQKSTVVCNFNDLKLDEFSHRVVEGKFLYLLEAEVETTFTPAGRLLHFVMRSRGKEVGRAQLVLPTE
ncbi:hypothetical protein BDV59DRAFT_204409 [Aspergillus ambiguus]|uniref:uncharacterized protein n=1 Tax=Aspergillus ambiguus TaxID=176160 RepID=UPI003CCE399E